MLLSHSKVTVLTRGSLVLYDKGDCALERCPSVGLGIEPRLAKPSCCGLAGSDLQTRLGGRLALPPCACDDTSSAHVRWAGRDSALGACFLICQHGCVSGGCERVRGWRAGHTGPAASGLLVAQQAAEGGPRLLIKGH